MRGRGEAVVWAKKIIKQLLNADREQIIQDFRQYFKMIEIGMKLDSDDHEMYTDVTS